MNKKKTRKARTTCKKAVNSKNLLGPTDITRKITGLEVDDSLFEGNKKKVERILKKIKKSSNISDSKFRTQENFNEISPDSAPFAPASAPASALPASAPASSFLFMLSISLYNPLCSICPSG